MVSVVHELLVLDFCHSCWFGFSANGWAAKRNLPRKVECKSFAKLKNINLYLNRVVLTFPLYLYYLYLYLYLNQALLPFFVIHKSFPF